MFGSIKNETSLLDAFNMQEGACALEQQLEFQNLSLSQKIIRVVSDCIIKLVAYVLGVQIIDRNVEALGQRYDDYTNLPLQSADYCQNKEVILVLHINGSIPTEPAHFEKLEKQSNYKVVFKELASIEEANAGMKKLKENGCAIKALWIRAHGTPTKITFSQNLGRPDTLDITEDEFEENPEYRMPRSKLAKVRSFCEAINENLEKDAPIILESCSTGKPMSDRKENIATCISRMAQRKVFAPKKEALNIDDGVSYSNETGFKVEIKRFKADRYFAPGSFLAKLSAIWFAFRGYKEDITQIIEPQPLINE